MNNIIDYVKWRGDLSFSASPFNEVDCSILCELIYIKFNGVIFDKPITIKKAYSIMSDENADEKIKNNFLSANDERRELFEQISTSPRFKSMQLMYYHDVFNTENPEQFAAVTVKFDKNFYAVVFRGTDKTIVGLKEDFSIILEWPVQAQLDSKAYLEFVAKKTKGKLIVAGHSKGGNLAMYACVNCQEKYKNQIDSVYNFDGPLTADKDSFDYKTMSSKINTYVPQASIFGLLFDHQAEYNVVHSTEISGFIQHNIFSWELDKTSFVRLKKAKNSGHIFDETVRELYQSLTPEQLETFIETLYDVLSSNNIATLYDLLPSSDTRFLPIFAAIRRLDPTSRRLMFDIVAELFETSAKNIRDIKNSIQFKHWLNKDE